MLFKKTISQLTIQSLFRPHALFLNFAKFVKDYYMYKKQFTEAAKDSIFSLDNFSLFPCVLDANSDAGQARGHYFYQDIYVASQIISNSPKLHLDFGSRVDGFIGHLISANLPVVIGDIRPLYIQSSLVSHLQFDLMKAEAVSIVTNKYISISCLHVLEHMGLGRYGDPININGHLIALKNIVSLLEEGGLLYVSFPIASESRLEFNAHRVFSVEYAEDWFKSLKLKVVDFRYIGDDGYMADEYTNFRKNMNVNLSYGCGIWTLAK